LATGVQVNVVEVVAGNTAALAGVRLVVQSGAVVGTPVPVGYNCVLGTIVFTVDGLDQRKENIPVI